MRIAIIGGGIAGSAVGLALRRRGHDVRIFERDGTRRLGAGVVLWPNATFVLGALGLLDELVAAGGRPRRMDRFDAAGAALGGWDLEALDDAMGAPTVSVLRADLLRVLHQALARSGVAIEEGHRAIAFDAEEHGRCGRVRFAGGMELEAELILGADGRHSAARAFVRRDAGASAVYQGFVNWVGISPLPLEEPIISDHRGDAQRFGIVPVGEQVYWAGACRRDEPPARDEQISRAELAARFASWPALVREAIARAPADRFRTIGIHDVEPALPWHRGRVLLVGDAAHAAAPTSGQGVGQALEDAWHLGQVLPADGADLAGALEAFTARRFEKTRAITHAGRGLARALFHPEQSGAMPSAPPGSDADAVRGLAALWGSGLVP